MTKTTPLAALERGITLRSSNVCKELSIGLRVCGVCAERCVEHRLAEPRLIASARDTYLKPQVSLPVNDDVLRGHRLDFGQDILHSLGRPAPRGYSVGTDEQRLKSHMRYLLRAFAPGDTERKARRLMDAFLGKKQSIEVFTDPAFDSAVAEHENFKDFAALTLATPGTKGTTPGKIRIHQALQRAGWDIGKVSPITDLGVPAFMQGSKLFHTGDYNGGLGLMVGGVQHVLVYVTSYEYASCKSEYKIGLKFVLYDVFGLDDEDLTDPVLFGLATTGAPNDAWSDEQIGITAWWQLQHQMDYAPLITRAVVEPPPSTVSTGGY